LPPAFRQIGRSFQKPETELKKANRQHFIQGILLSKARKGTTALKKNQDFVDSTVIGETGFAHSQHLMLHAFVPKITRRSVADSLKRKTLSPVFFMKKLLKEFPSSAASSMARVLP